MRVLNPQGTAVGDAGGAAGSSLPGQGYLTELGVTNTGSPVCINDALINSPGGFHQLCLGANSLGGGLISYNAYGEALALPLNCDINGVSAPCLVSQTTTITDSKVTAIIADGAAFTAFSQPNLSGQAIYNQAVMSGNATTFNSYDALRGVNNATPNSTVNTITGVAGYVVNNTVPIGQRSQTAALFGIGVCAVNSSDCWGVDTIVSDNPTQTNTGVTTGTGKFLYNEFDFNITSPNTQGAALQVGGTALPTNVTLNINAIVVNKLWGAGGAGTGTALYGNGFITADACCAAGLTLGAAALTGASQNGQPIFLNYRAANNTEQNIELQAVPVSPGTGASLFLGGTGSSDNLVLVSGGLFLPSVTSIAWNNNSAISSDGTSTINVGTAATPWTALGLGNSSTTVTINGSTIGLGSSGATVNVGTVGASNVFLGSATSTLTVSADSVIATNLPSQAHAGSNACLGYNATTHAIYVSTTITTC